MRLNWRRVAAFGITITLTFAIIAFAPPQMAMAAPAIDQEQPTIDTSPAFSFIIGGLTQQILAQTVTAGATGDLVRVDLPVACPSTEDLVVDVRDVAGGGEPGPTSLSTTTVPGTALPPFPVGGVTFRAITLATPVAVAPGTQFAIVLSSAATTTNCSLFPGPVGDSYAAGDQYVDSLNHSDWLCACDVANSRQDLPFKTWVEPPGADVSITKTLLNPNNLIVFSGTVWAYELKVTNSGPGDATGVTITDTLPTNVTYVGGQTGCSESAGTVTCSVGSLSSGSQASFVIFVQFDLAGTYVNSASVSANESDPDSSDNTASETTQVYPSADLSLAGVLVEYSRVEPSGRVTIATTITNDGPDATGEVMVLQTIPSGSAFVSVTSQDASIVCGQGASSSEYGCRFGSMAVGDERTMKLELDAPVTAGLYQSTITVSHNITSSSTIILDPDSTNDSLTVEFVVVDETVSQTTSAGGTVTTDASGDGATADDPIETTVTSPASGAVTITEQMNTGAPVSNWELLDLEVVISAPAGTLEDPIWITFRFEGTALPTGFTAQDIEVIRNDNFLNPVPACTSPIAPALPGPSSPISPDPCVYARTTLSDGDVEIVVLTTQASVWNFAVREPFDFGGFEDPVRDGMNFVNAGRVVPVKFSLGGFQGMTVLNTATPLSRSVGCDDAAAGPLEAIDVVGKSLAYDASTDTYSIRWDTDPAWAGTCRELVLQLADGSEHTALFQFK